MPRPRIPQNTVNNDQQSKHNIIYNFNLGGINNNSSTNFSKPFHSWSFGTFHTWNFGTINTSGKKRRSVKTILVTKEVDRAKFFCCLQEVRYRNIVKK